MPETEKVHIETLLMIVRRLSNQMPTRYYLYTGPTDAPTSVMRLELWCNPHENFEHLNSELGGYGFAFEGTERRAVIDEEFVLIIRTYVAERLEDTIPPSGKRVTRILKNPPEVGHERIR